MTHSNQVNLLPNDGWDPRILICQNDDLVQCFVVVTERYLVIVDTMINPTTALAMLRHARPYMSAKRRLLVINTHADYDHSWGNAIFAGPDAPYRAPIVGHILCAERLAEPAARASLEKMQYAEWETFAGVTLHPPNFLFTHRLVVDGGDLTLDLFHTPGHTPDHVSIYIPQIDTLLAGDAAEFPFPVARQASALFEMRASLAALADCQASVVLYCHAPVSAGPQLLLDNQAYFNHLEACCRDALVRGVPADPPADVDLIALVNCPFEESVPATEAWRNVHPHDATTGHTAQIRMMLQALSAGREPL